MTTRVQSIEGFVLTRGWRDTRRGLRLTVWMWTASGPLRVDVAREQAVMFVPRGTPARAARRREVALTDLAGDPVDAVYFDARRALLDERDRLRQEGNQVFESDVRPVERYLMERFVTGGCRVNGIVRSRSGFSSCDDPKLSRADVVPALRVLSLDIETDGPHGPIIAAATVTRDGQELALMVGEGPPAPSVRYVRDEASLLRSLFDEVRRRDPDLLVGWNVVGFDLVHLQERCEALRVPFALGRGGERAAILLPRSSQQLPIARIPGRAVLDGIRGLEAATYSFESFALEDVAQELLGRGKAIDEPSDRVKEIQRLYREDKPALAAYNLEDCRLVLGIMAHTRLVDFAIARQTMTGLPISRVGGSVAAFDHLYLPRMHRKGAVAPDVGASGRSDLIAPGGYVLASRPGLYRNVAVCDFKSLYPSIIRTFRVDPYGLSFPGDDPVEGFDGATFARDEPILPAMIEELWRQRDAAKAAGDAARSQAIKILMNSFYGVLGTPGCRFFDPRLASSITRRGHEVITRTRDRLVEQGLEVIYGDTDSLFVWLGDDDEPEACRERARTLVAELNRWWHERVEEEHGVECALELEFEVLYERFYLPTLRGSDQGSAKRYAGLVDGERVVIKGLEAVRTDWTPFARTLQRELLRRVFADESYESWLRDVRRQLLAGELDDQLVYRKRLRRDVSDYQRSVPPHVKAARLLDTPGKHVRYVITPRGPEPIELKPRPLDHRHYLERQMAPAVQGILTTLGTSFEVVAGDQLGLF